jgi:hypothetical protein
MKEDKLRLAFGMLSQKMPHELISPAEKTTALHLAAILTFANRLSTLQPLSCTHSSTRLWRTPSTILRSLPHVYQYAGPVVVVNFVQRQLVQLEV